jgi:hypothetical protein
MTRITAVTRSVFAPGKKLEGYEGRLSPVGELRMCILAESFTNGHANAMDGVACRRGGAVRDGAFSG